MKAPPHLRPSTINPTLVILLSLLSTLSIWGIAHPPLVYGSGSNLLGVDCGLGSLEAVPDPLTGVPAADGILDGSCTWAGDVDATVGAPDDVPDPLVSDNPSSLPEATGGGLTVEVRIVGLSEQINGVDIRLHSD